MYLSVKDWWDESGKREYQISMFKLHLRVIRTDQTVISGICENLISLRFKVSELCKKLFYLTSI